MTGPTGSVSRRDDTATTSTPGLAARRSTQRVGCAPGHRDWSRARRTRARRRDDDARGTAAAAVAAPAQAAPFSLVEVRPGRSSLPQADRSASSFRQHRSLARARRATVSPAARRRAGALRASPSTGSYPSAATSSTRCCPGEWWLDAIGATKVVPPGPGIPVAVIDTGLDLAHPEFAGRADTTALNAQSIVDTCKRLPRHCRRIGHRRPGKRRRDGRRLPAGRPLRLRRGPVRWDHHGELIAGIDAAAERSPIVINLSLGSIARGSGSARRRLLGRPAGRARRRRRRELWCGRAARPTRPTSRTS